MIIGRTLAMLWILFSGPISGLKKYLPFLLLTTGLNRVFRGGGFGGIEVFLDIVDHPAHGFAADLPFQVSVDVIEGILEFKGEAIAADLYYLQCVAIGDDVLFKF